MSTNAFARSRPRVRHQRVPKSHDPTHPRFLQLVRELERLDAVKKKQEIIEGDSRGNTSCSGGNSETTLDNRVRHAPGCSEETVAAAATTFCPVNAIASNQPVVIESCDSNVGSFNCTSPLNAAHTSNGYRSLDCDQTTSTLNDSYYRQNNNSHNHGNLYMHHQHNFVNSHSHHNHHHQLQIGSQIIQHSYRDIPGYYSNNSTHNAHQQPVLQEDHCSSSKCLQATTTSATLATSLSKSSLEQDNSGLSTTSVDLRQDENRSKRKRVSNELSSSMSASKKLPSSSSCSTASSNKRHKPSPEPPRPLSPSFTKCPICLLDCMDRDPSFTNTCFHLFCYVCIENWTKNKATCPLCRTKFTKIIYNIRSESCYGEKIACPINRDEDDDRIIYEQLQGLNTNPIVLNRNAHSDEARLLFDNLRGSDVLMQPFGFVAQIDQRQDSINNFNSTTTGSFNTTVSHTPFTSYNPMTSNYLLIPSGHSRLQQLTNTVTSAFIGNTGSNSSGVDSGRVSRTSRSGRYIYSRNYADLQPVDNSTRLSRETSSNLSPSGTERTHQHQNHYLTDHQHGQHRSNAADMGARQRMERTYISHMYPNPRYLHPNSYSRRPFIEPTIDPHILDNLYRHMPDN